MSATELISLKNGQTAIVKEINANKKAKKRLMDLGLLPNTKVKIIRKAPFRGPIEVEVRGAKFALGRRIAAKVLVKKI